MINVEQKRKVANFWLQDAGTKHETSENDKILGKKKGYIKENKPKRIIKATWNIWWHPVVTLFDYPATFRLQLFRKISVVRQTNKKTMSNQSRYSFRITKIIRIMIINLKMLIFNTLRA